MTIPPYSPKQSVFRSKDLGTIHLGVSKNSGTPKWMEKKKNPIKIDDLGVKPPIFGNTHLIANHL